MDCSMPGFSSKLDLFGKACLYTILGMVSSTQRRGQTFGDKGRR